jgi:hypothetical protein
MISKQGASNRISEQHWSNGFAADRSSTWLPNNDVVIRLVRSWEKQAGALRQADLKRPR